MWEPDEQERYETAVVRAMTDEQPPATRVQALALCFVVGTPRLLQAAERVASGGRFPELEVRALDVAAQPWRELVDAGQRLRGDVPNVERLLVRAVTNRDDFAADVTLDWVDV